MPHIIDWSMPEEAPCPQCGAGATLADPDRYDDPERVEGWCEDCAEAEVLGGDLNWSDAVLRDREEDLQIREALDDA